MECPFLNQVPRSPFTTKQQPFGAAFSPLIGTSTLYSAVTTTFNPGQNIDAFSVNTSTGFFKNIGSPPTGSVMDAVAFSPLVSNNLFAAATSFVGPNNVFAYQVNPATGAFSTVLGSPFAGGNGASDITFSPFFSGNLFVAVTNQTSDNISVFDVDTTTGVYSSVGTFSSGVGSQPGAIAFSPVIGIKLFAATANTGLDNVAVYSVDSDGVFTPIDLAVPAGLSPSGISFSPLIGTSLFAAVANFDGDTLSVYTVDSDGIFTLIQTVATGSKPRSVVFSPIFNGQLFTAVSNSQDNTISLFNVNTTTGIFTEVTSSTFPTGLTPLKLAFSPVVGPNLYLAATNSGDATVSVYALNLGPISSDSSLNLCSGQPTQGMLMATAAPGASITSFAIVTGPTNGTVTPPTASGAFTYTPNVGLTGPDSFTFRATDSNGCVSDSATVSILVNRLPVATGNSFATCFNTPFSGLLQATASGGATITNYALTISPTHGSIGLIAATGAFNYTPTPGYVGPDDFVFSATDSNGCISNLSIITITVFSMPTLTISVNPTAIVLGDSAVLTAMPSAGTAPYQIIWSDGVVQNNVIESSTRTVSPQIKTTYSARIIDANGCQSDPSNAVTLCVLTGSPLANAIFLKYCSCRITT